MLCVSSVVSFFFFFSQFLSSLSHGLLSFSQPSCKPNSCLSLLVSFESHYYVIILSQYYKISSCHAYFRKELHSFKVGKQNWKLQNKYKNIHVTKICDSCSTLFIHSFSLTNKNEGLFKNGFMQTLTLWLNIARANLIRKYSKGNKKTSDGSSRDY